MYCSVVMWHILTVNVGVMLPDTLTLLESLIVPVTLPDTLVLFESLTVPLTLDDPLSVPLTLNVGVMLPDTLTLLEFNHCARLTCVECGLNTGAAVVGVLMKDTDSLEALLRD